MRTEKDLTMDTLKGYDISDLGSHYDLAKRGVAYHKKGLKQATASMCKSSKNYHVKELHKAKLLQDSIANLIVFLYRQHAAIHRKQVTETAVTKVLKKVSLKLTVVEK